jgi:methyl-accepting chemotaxis protein
VVCRDDQCDLGKWIHAPGKHGNDVDFAELKREHAVFHVQAAAVLDAIGAKNAQQAQQLLDRPYARVSTHVIMLLARLRERAA